MIDFVYAFACAFLLNAALTFRSSDLYKTWCRPQKHLETADVDTLSSQHRTWKSLIFRYLIVYLLATSADWLQGAYIYVLYHELGYSKYDIGVLFIAGFGSSAVFGSFIGGMADTKGRRLFVVVYGLAYTLSCVTKHFKIFWVLIIGRILGGIATSLLFSIFEAWLIRAHANAQLDSPVWLSKSFTWAAYGNSIIAIASGLIANHAAESSTMHPVTHGSTLHTGGYLAPFDMALVVSVACGAAALYCWEENYGECPAPTALANHRDAAPSSYGGLGTAFTVTMRSREILLCGVVSALYEGSMYIFIFMWTPALMQASGDAAALPFGLIFSTFMVCSMAGSSLFSIWNDYIRLEHQAFLVLLLAAFSTMLLLVTTDQTSQYFSMNLFELSIGMYFPVIGCLKSAIVPESQRAAIYNLYRIPLNLIVLLGLLTDVSPDEAFSMNLAMLLLAAALQLALIRCREKNGRTKVPKTLETESLTTEESDTELSQV